MTLDKLLLPLFRLFDPPCFESLVISLVISSNDNGGFLAVFLFFFGFGSSQYSSLSVSGLNGSNKGLDLAWRIGSVGSSGSAGVSGIAGLSSSGGMSSSGGVSGAAGLSGSAGVSGDSGPQGDAGVSVSKFNGCSALEHDATGASSSVPRSSSRSSPDCASGFPGDSGLSPSLGFFAGASASSDAVESSFLKGFVSYSLINTFSHLHKDR